MKDITTDRFLLDTQIKIKIVIDATGVAFISITSGSCKIFRILYFAHKGAVTNESMIEIRRPKNMRLREKAIEAQNDDVLIKSKSLNVTSTGDARSTDESNAIAATCHMTK